MQIVYNNDIIESNIVAGLIFYHGTRGDIAVVQEENAVDHYGSF
jgi:hypothetical protein